MPVVAERNKKFDLLLEAESREILPERELSLLNEARTRGLIPSLEAPEGPPVALEEPFEAIRPDITLQKETPPTMRERLMDTLATKGGEAGGFLAEALQPPDVGLIPEQPEIGLEQEPLITSLSDILSVEPPSDIEQFEEAPLPEGYPEAIGGILGQAAIGVVRGNFDTAKGLAKIVGIDPSTIEQIDLGPDPKNTIEQAARTAGSFMGDIPLMIGLGKAVYAIPGLRALPPNVITRGIKSALIFMGIHQAKAGRDIDKKELATAAATGFFLGFPLSMPNLPARIVAAGGLGAGIGFVAGEEPQEILHRSLQTAFLGALGGQEPLADIRVDRAPRAKRVRTKPLTEAERVRVAKPAKEVAPKKEPKPDIRLEKRAPAKRKPAPKQKAPGKPLAEILPKAFPEVKPGPGEPKPKATTDIDPKDIKKIEDCRPAECYRNARRAAMANPDSEVVQGNILAPGLGKRIDHAWVEIGETVYDPTIDLVMPRARYYEDLKAKPEERLTDIEAQKLMIRVGKEGPYTKQEIADMRATVPVSPERVTELEVGAPTKKPLLPPKKAEAKPARAKLLERTKAGEQAVIPGAEAGFPKKAIRGEAAKGPIFTAKAEAEARKRQLDLEVAKMDPKEVERLERQKAIEVRAEAEEEFIERNKRVRKRVRGLKLNRVAFASELGAGQIEGISSDFLRKGGALTPDGLIELLQEEQIFPQSLKADDPAYPTTAEGLDKFKEILSDLPSKRSLLTPRIRGGQDPSEVTRFITGEIEATADVDQLENILRKHSEIIEGLPQEDQEVLQYVIDLKKDHIAGRLAEAKKTEAVFEEISAEDRALARALDVDLSVKGDVPLLEPDIVEKLKEMDKVVDGSEFKELPTTRKPIGIFRKLFRAKRRSVGDDAMLIAVRHKAARDQEISRFGDRMRNILHRWKPSLIQAIEKKRLGKRQEIFDWMDGKTIKLDPEQMKAIPKMRKLFDEMGKFYEQEIIKHYAPRRRDVFPDAVAREFAPDEIENVHRLQRTGQMENVNRDIWTATLGYIRTNANEKHVNPMLIEMAPFLQKLDASRRQIADDWINHQILGIPTETQKALNTSIRKLGKIAGLNLSDRAYQALTTRFMTLHMTGTIAWRLKMVTRNAAQQSLIVIRDGLTNYLKAVAMRKTAEGREVLEKSAALKARNNFYIENQEDQAPKGWDRKIFDVGMTLYRGIDRINVETAFLSGWTKSKGQPKTERIREGDLSVAETQYLYGLDMPGIMTGAGKPAFSYWSWPLFFTDFVVGLFEAKNTAAIGRLVAVSVMFWLLKETTGVDWMGSTALGPTANLLRGRFGPLATGPYHAMRGLAELYSGDTKKAEREFKKAWRTLKPSAPFVGWLVFKDLEDVSKGKAKKALFHTEREAKEPDKKRLIQRRSTPLPPRRKSLLPKRRSTGLPRRRRQIR